MRLPHFAYERHFQKMGHVVVGVDEVGCGCLAGPVVAAALHLPLTSRIGRVADSKLLSPSRRYEIFKELIKANVKFGIGIASVAEIDAINIRQASLLAMRRAVEAFGNATCALVDAWKIPGISITQIPIIHGDRIVKSIAAASIVAKVIRDRLMEEYDQEYPEYGLARHKGYGTLVHRIALLKNGPTLLHRKSFRLRF